MNEKTRLMGLFKKAADATDEFKEDRREVMNSDLLSTKGKDEEVFEFRRQFAEAIEGYRDQMLAIVDEREKDYVAFRIKEAQDHMKSSDYLAALTANLDMLERGYMGKVEVMALLGMYNFDDLATSRIHEVMHRTKNPYCNLIEDRITINKQLNAFESIRNVIRSKVNAGLADKPDPYPSPAVASGLKKANYTREQFYFGLGYRAIEDELEEDLAINSPNASLAGQQNGDKNNTFHAGNNIQNMKARNPKKSRKGKQTTTQEE